MLDNRARSGRHPFPPVSFIPRVPIGAGLAQSNIPFAEIDFTNRRVQDGHVSEAESKIVEHYGTSGLLARFEAGPLAVGTFRLPRHGYRLALIHGDIAGATLANVARGYQDGSLVPIEVVARKQ
jgi:hypothetical protein